MAQETAADDSTELAKMDGVSAVEDSCESGVAYVLKCEDYDVQAVHVQLLKSDKWTPRGNYKNEVSPSDCYVKAAYHVEYLN